MNKYFLLSLGTLCLVSCDDMTGQSVCKPIVDKKELTDVEKESLQTPKQTKKKEKQSFFSTSLTVDDGDVYKILITSDASDFRILLNDEILIDSAELTPEEAEKINPIARQMSHDLALVASAEEVIYGKAENRKMAYVAEPVTNKNVLRVARMKSRIRSAKERLVKGISDMVEILIRFEDESLNSVSQANRVMIKVSKSKEQRLISAFGQKERY